MTLTEFYQQISRRLRHQFERGVRGASRLLARSECIFYRSSSYSSLGADVTFRANVPQLFAEIDCEKAKKLNVSLNEVFGTLQAYLVSAYVNDFKKFGRTWQVRAQADHQFRVEPEDIRRLDVRDASGRMILVGTLVDLERTPGPQTILRYNLFPSASLTGSAAPGFSSGQALDLMEQMADGKLPASMGYGWTGMSFQEKQVGSEAMMIFALAIVLVFLVLAAQYESWTNPAAVILVVPLAGFGAVVALVLRDFNNNVYTQIGIVLLIGIASKNAILMRAISSIAGFMLLVVASGAGAASRQAIGTAVVGGMIAATIMSLTFTPVFYVVMQRLSELRGRSKTGESTPVTEPSAETA